MCPAGSPHRKIIRQRSPDSQSDLFAAAISQFSWESRALGRCVQHVAGGLLGSAGTSYDTHVYFYSKWSAGCLTRRAERGTAELSLSAPVTLLALVWL